MVANEKAYFANALEIVEYDFATKEYNCIIQDGADSSIQINENKLFYIPHSSRTFSICQYDLINHSLNFVAGKNVEKPDADIIEDFVICNNKIFYFQTFPSKMAGIDEDYLLLNTEVISINKKGSAVYFVLKENGTNKLYRFENEEKVFIWSMNISDNSNFTIVDNCIVYISDNNEIIVLELK